MRQELPAMMAEPSELVRGALPDPGPRFERLPEIPEWKQFEQGVGLYHQGQYLEARLHFTNMLRDRRESPLRSSIQAFLAESTLQSHDPGVRPLDIIDQYKTLMRENPQSTNAKRAAWRIGDVYRIEGWFQEAQIAYQHALSLSEIDSFDANRAMLGLAYVQRGFKNWKESTQTFDHVLKRTVDPTLLVSASLGEAHSLYRLGRMKDADALYESISGRWPAALRSDAFALLRYADTAGEAKRGPVMREQLLHFYNLYPNRPETPFVLTYLADSYKEAGRWAESSIFYAALLSQYPEAPVAATARLRYADVQEHLDPEGEEINLRHTISAHLDHVPLKAGEMLSPRRLFEQSAKDNEGSIVGSEALFHLGETLERAGKPEGAVRAYEQVVLRSGKFDNDPWPEKGGVQLVRFLRPRLEAALKAEDDFELINIFHRHGPFADRLYAGTELLLKIAEAHRRLGFPVESARLFQSLVRDAKAEKFHEAALMGLAYSYMEQKDMRAARSVFERYRLEFPTGRFSGEALRGILNSFEGEGNLAALLKLGKQWLAHNPRHHDRTMVQLKLAAVLAQSKQPAEAAAIYDGLIKAGQELPAADLLRHAEVLARLNRRSQALAMYKEAVVAGLELEQEAWAQLQMVQLARGEKREDFAKNGLRALSVNPDSLVRRMAAMLDNELPEPPVDKRGKKP
ncbi:MAG TPA: tetratricopeptide repeat protein [Nitrospira sp.]|nr:tetratricopeptide repeat protein [Nitrospira sp.]